MLVDLVLLDKFVDCLNAIELSISFLFLVHGSLVKRESNDNRLIKFTDCVLINLAHLLSTKGLGSTSYDYFNHATHEPELKFIPHVLGVVHCFLSTLS